MLIAFHSKGQEVGKDTAGQLLIQWAQSRGKTAQRLAFADDVKKLAALSLGHGAAQEGDWDAVIAVMDQLKMEGRVGWGARGNPAEPWITGRDFIINLAEGARQLFGQEFWTSVTLPRDGSTLVGVDVTAITDLRFEDEANRVAELGGAVVEIRSNRAVNAGGRSEAGLDPVYIDIVIENNGTLDEFKQAVWRLADSVRSQLG